MPTCKSCGAELRQGDVFCASCGTRRTGQEDAEGRKSWSLESQDKDVDASLTQGAFSQPSVPRDLIAPTEPALTERPGHLGAPLLTAGVPGSSNYNTITNTINLTPPAIVMNMRSPGTPLIVRAIWWFFIGWWLSAIVAFAGWFFLATIIFIPLGIWLIHRIPQAQTLRPRTRSFHTEFKDGTVVFTESIIPQHPWYVRLFYMLFCGLWIGLPWILLGWALGLTLILLPLSIWMLDRAPAVTTLQRH